MSDTLSVYKIQRGENEPRYFGSIYPALAEDWNDTDVTILHWVGGRQ